MFYDKNIKTKIIDYKKELLKEIKDRTKRKQLKNKKNGMKVFIIDFNHNDKSNAFVKFEKDVDTVILNSKKGDEVIITINTPGGAVTSYANASTQIKRLKDSGLYVYGYIDEIAASGGYMMASVCHKIVAQPLAFVGSIGVVSQVFIFEELMKKVGVNGKVYTAGKNKRSVTPFKEPTDEEEETFKEKLKEIHEAFKSHVLENRKIDTNKFMEGDFYLAKDVLDDNFVDKISDSKTDIFNKLKEGYDIFYINTKIKSKSKGILGFIGLDLENITEGIVSSVANKINRIIY